MFLLVRKFDGTTRSTVAPFGIRPTVGTFTVNDLPSSPEAPSPPTTKLPCANAYVSPSAPSNGVIRRVPPFNDCAPTRVDTVISMVCPGFMNGFRSAVTITAAAFEAFKSSTSVTIPKRATIVCID